MMELNPDERAAVSGMRQKSLVAALMFSMPMTLEDLRKFLSNGMKRKWLAKDSEFFGDYIAIKKKDTRTIMRVFEVNDGYLVDFLNRDFLEESRWLSETEEFVALLQEGGGTKFSAADNNY